MRHLFFLCALLLLVPSAPAAQISVSGLSPGTRIRISVDQLFIVGHVGELNANSLKITGDRAGDQFVFPFSAIASLERSLGRSRGAGARRGATVGTVAGVGLGVVCVFVCPTQPGGGANLAPMGGLMYGAPAGAALGAILANERWGRLPHPARSDATPTNQPKS